MPQHVPKPGAGDTGPRGVRIADGEYGFPITSQCMPVDKIRIGTRHRRDLDDIAGLAESIALHALELLRRDAQGRASTPLDATTASEAMR